VRSTSRVVARSKVVAPIEGFVVVSDWMAEKSSRRFARQAVAGGGQKSDAPTGQRIETGGGRASFDEIRRGGPSVTMPGANCEELKKSAHLEGKETQARG